jgi:hypothetical protein
MARNVTLLEIRTEIVNQGGYKNSPVFTTPVLNTWINRALAKVYDLVWQSGDDYYTDETALFTIAGSDAVVLPADFKKLIGLGRLDGNTYRRLRRMRISEWAKWSGSSGAPTRYRIQKGNLRLAAPPDAIYTLKALYLPVAPTLAADGDTFDSIDYFDELAIAYVLLKCGGRDERGLGDLKDNIATLERNIRSQATARDAAEPEYLADLSDEDDEGWF